MAFLERLHRAVREHHDALRVPIPVPRRGPFRREAWRSPLRGPWLSSALSAALLPLILICAGTGFLSHAAYGENAFTSGFDQRLYFFTWPTRPEWLYSLTQGVHVIAGLATIPILFAKLWAVIPNLWERPAARSVSHLLERVTLALLVGGSLFVYFSGVYNVQYYYMWGAVELVPGPGFFFVPVHYYAAFLFLAALSLHLVLKLPLMAEAFRAAGVLAPLREGRAETRPEPPERGLTAPIAPTEPTISRRGLVGAVGASSVAVALLSVGQVIGGPLRATALLAPRGRDYGEGPNDFQVNKPASAAGIGPGDVGGDWRLELVAGGRRLSFPREELLAMALATADLPIACVEGWTTWQTWTGVRLGDLARLAGAGEGSELVVQSIQRGGFSRSVLNPGQVSDPRSMLALRVNGADLSLDHGYPARLIVPALPGVLNTKWVKRMSFAAEV
jgi:DMSO/TMAO reductase YedYZ molybdopterin-dependent catalytic subunit